MMLGSTPSTIPDYVTILKPQNIAWNLKETNNQVEISTAILKVFVKSDGTIEYQTKDNHKLVSETN